MDLQISWHLEKKPVCIFSMRTNFGCRQLVGEELTINNTSIVVYCLGMYMSVSNVCVCMYLCRDGCVFG